MMKLASFIKENLIQVQLCIIAVLISLILYFNLNISNDRILTINIILISATGIFSAILISSLLTGISIHYQTSQTIAESVFKISKKLTQFRKVLHYLTISEEIWGTDFYRNFLMKLRREYPLYDRQTSKYDLKEKDKRAQVVNDSRFGDRRTRLFLGMLTVKNVSYRNEIKILESFNEEYDLDYLLNSHDAINDIWYYIEHRGADVDFNLNGINRLFRDDFEKSLLNLRDEDSLKNFDEYVLSELASEFYSEHHIKHIVLTRFLESGLPNIYKIIFVELIILLIVGLVIPVINLTINHHSFELLTNISVVLVLMVFSFMIYHLARLIFNNHNYSIHKYT